MNIIVCVKQVPDPEAPPASFKVDPAANKVVPPAGVAPVVSPFDEQAVEAALRIKDKQKDTKIIILSLGDNLVRDVIKKPLSMGADELVLLEDPAYEEGDSWSTAYALSKAIEKIGSYDLILCGRQAADWDAGQVGTGIAEFLDLPCVTVARKIEAGDGKANIERVTEDGYEVIEAALPCLVTVSNELGEPRYAALKGIMAAAKKKPMIWKPGSGDGDTIAVSADEIGVKGKVTKLEKLYQPVKEAKCEIIEGETPADAAVALAQRLREAKVI